MVDPTSSTAASAPTQMFSPPASEDSAAPFILDPGQTTPLCFVLPEGVTLATPPLHVLSWRPEAGEVLSRMNALLYPGALPTRALITLAELHLPGLQRLDARMGTAYGDRQGEMAWSNEPDRARLLAGAMTMAGHWITGSLDEIGRARAGDAALQAALQDFRNLHARGALFADQTLPLMVYRWGAHPSGTARNGHPASYPALADAAANTLRGHELLRGHGVMRRVIPRHTQGHAELIGDPVRGSDGTWTSLVLRLRVLSLPGCPRPLVAVHLYRNCWRTDHGARPGHTTGYVLAEQNAHAFTVSEGASPHSVNSEYRELARAYELAAQPEDAQRRGGRARVVIQQRGPGGQRVTASVPDHDQLAVLHGAAALLAPLGLTPWTGVCEVGTRPGTLPEVVLGFTALPLGPSVWGALTFRVWPRSGDVEARVAFDAPETPHQLRFGPWESVPQALERLVGAQPLTLKSVTSRAQFQRFIEQTVQGELEEGRAPLVTVDSTHAVRLWPWLADSRVDLQRIEFAQLGRRDLQVAWGRAGVRLMRLRQNNAPPVAVGGPKRGTARLLRVQDTTIPTYLAFGPTPGPDAHAPCPVELSVLLTQPGDEPDRLARLVSGLLSGYGNPGGGPVLPTPQRFVLPEGATPARFCTR